MNFTEPQLDMKAACIVPDYRKEAFRKREAVRKIARLRIAVTPANTQAEVQAKKSFPVAHLVELAAIKGFFTQAGAADAFDHRHNRQVLGLAVSVAWGTAFRVT